jgi:hypothetical protein
MKDATSMAESLQYMMGGDTSVTEQFFATLRRSEHLEPEKNLFIAILQDAFMIIASIAGLEIQRGGDTSEKRRSGSWQAVTTGFFLSIISANC